jgi:aryl-alcohol dehydrogenase-like predicted oxidoreductase
MHSTILGDTGLALSRLGFGTAGLMRQGSTRERLNLLAAAFDVGITHYDTAPIYGLGQSEQLLGRFARGRRTSLTIATKFGLGLNPMASALSGVQSLLRRIVRGSPALRRVARRRAEALYRPPAFSARIARTSLESSLRRLGTDHVDLLLLHDCSLASDISDDLLTCLENLRWSGMVRGFGIATAFRNLLPFQAVYPALCEVLQFDSDIFSRNAARILVNEAGRGLVTHSVMTSAYPLLRATLVAEPELARGWSDALGLDVTGNAALGSLLIASALAENTNGPVLVHTSSIDHMQANARAVDQIAVRTLARFGELVAERFAGSPTGCEIPPVPPFVKGGLAPYEERSGCPSPLVGEGRGEG